MTCLSNRQDAKLIVVLYVAALCGLVSPAVADETDLAASRSTAVALNYCRASFHRMQRTPSKRVLLEEQEKILNNLNLNGIADAEVVQLYTAVLGEIADVQIAEREREVIRATHRKAFLRDLSVNAFALGTQVSTAQYLSAVQTGARSWWDYRSHVFSRELDLWKVEKDRMHKVVDKSSLFLDTFWKLARKRDIPDHWLVRGQDLDDLAEAVREEQPEVRLRVLRRMERFMECFPPYYYYVARTEQELGRWTESVDSYRKLARFGDDYFRRDEMLAAGLCNQALIEDYLRLASAPETARRALRQATDAWEVNLVSAMVLLRHGQSAAAEDALLRNLDVGLESDQSRVALLTVYRVAGDSRKLAQQLEQSSTVEATPMPLLLASVSAVGTGQVPTTATARLTTSLSAKFEPRFGRDLLVIEATSAWQLDRARMAVRIGDAVLTRPTVTVTRDGYQARFERADEDHTPTDPVTLVLQYPEIGELRVYLQELSAETVDAVARSDRRGLFQLPMMTSRSWHVTGVDLAGTRTLLSTSDSAAFEVIPIAGQVPERKLHGVAKPVGHQQLVDPTPLLSEEELPLVRPY